MEKLVQGAKKLGIMLDAKQVKQFVLYYKELIAWNKRINLTRIIDYAEAQVRHFLDSLTITLALSQEEMKKPDFNLIDLGTGAGFPGVPLKIALCEPRLVLIDSNIKKTAFLRHVVQKLELDNVEIIHGRAEEIGHQERYREQFDLVVSRAVASLPILLELALPFCRIGGKFVAQKKGEFNQELQKANKAINILGGKLNEVKNVGLEEFGDERCLVIFAKISSTPEKYPRRPGMPERRPIQEVRDVA